MYCLSSFFQHHGARRYGLSDARYRPRSQQGSISGKNCRFFVHFFGLIFFDSGKQELDMRGVFRYCNTCAHAAILTALSD